jgi:hypothetical protein
MKGSKIFAVAMVLLLCLILFLEIEMPTRFSWEPTFGTSDANPFGCAIFDSVLLKSIPAGYDVTGKTFSQLWNKHGKGRHGYLLIENTITLGKADIKNMKRLLKEGNAVLLAGHDFNNNNIGSDLGLSSSSTFFNFEYMKRDVTDRDSESCIVWTGDGDRYIKESFRCRFSLCYPSFDEFDTKYYNELAQYNDPVTNLGHKNVVLVMRKWGKGTLIVSSTPLVFSNYGMLQRGTSDYIFRALSEMGNVPITRIERHSGRNKIDTSTSPFYYIHSQRPLHWAFNLTMIAIVIFLITSARRRQRPIPVIRKVQSKVLEFAQTIGSLYYHYHDNADLIKKRSKYFIEEVRREYRIDISDNKNDESAAKVIAGHTGTKEESVKLLLMQIHSDVDYEYDDEETFETIAMMDDIIEKGKL